jgi:Na+-transporting NADH:ubiquinone oxidoreductase subunit C
VQYSARYVVLFAVAVCAVCSVFVASSAVLLKERQEANKALDLQEKVLVVAGLMTLDEDIEDEEIRRRFEKHIQAQIVNLATGNLAEDVDAVTFDQREAASDENRSSLAPPNRAKVHRVPDHARIFQVMTDGKLTGIILPIEGKGLWSTLYGFLALNPDGRTIDGITFYEHGETRSPWSRAGRARPKTTRTGWTDSPARPLPAAV